MKRPTLITALLLSTTTLFAQTPSTVSKKEIVSAPTKPQYQNVIQVSEADFSTLMELANHAKQRAIYDPNFEPAQAINYQRQIDAFLKDLGKRVKLDSVKVEVTAK